MFSLIWLVVSSLGYYTISMIADGILNDDNFISVLMGNTNMPFSGVCDVGEWA